MSRLNPCKRRDFIKKLRKLGFEQPRSGTRHQFMIYQQYRLTIPSNSEYSVPQLKMMIKEVENIMSREITIDEWNEL
ncbi:MAG: type II toxin-antitoxin system HicA family toxin [Microcystis aeruginosa Ma_QC_Ch_20071001_S25]|uniref:Type II toxin-antitoxin system HicA family toxin n=2 Tax=Microcystis aeruginosa TaxID=1126 RepID=A0A552G6Z8_MICAE|nr:MULTISPECIES: type II toxin-antitoxin system HicA family toxin [unclassified Microcystis]MCA2925948.1 type II toxin-antitoxin system HicA family toxin [Microcystis sp. M020S1]MCA2934363.1 type II toxin-antitoxin system HicA family toxin [Microcystis sp. M015S1]TRU28433.1 MAG: type II toxin-antitoxin system HicA family toxin [Microcystis aeruginosa Ma_SC_T_19800800_S464]TRU49576.1 MAG: type II toxin-antitoxin system HicA family toxin [Microcystis aeruginosa Ma_QC_Ch_20071001_S25]TRU54733.1 M